MKNILKSLFVKSQSTVVVCKKENPADVLVKLCESMKKKYKKICVVTINKPYSLLIKKFNERKVDYSKFYFIDCVSASMMEQIPSKQCTYISSPKALTELAINLNNLPKDVDLVILDNFSSLVFYNDPFLSLRFMNSVTSKFRKNSLNSICLVVGETKPEVLTDLSLFADKIISM